MNIALLLGFMLNLIKIKLTKDVTALTYIKVPKIKGFR
jgi:hypothetical protein